MRELLPVEFVDSEDGMLLGWIAMPAIPRIGDYVLLPALRPGQVLHCTWEYKKPGETFSMRDANIDPQWTQWVAKVALLLER